MAVYYLFLVIGTLIRFIGLGQSLWLDEAITANVVKNNTLYGVFTTFSPHDFHPPLYYFVLKLWTNFFGYSEVSLRLPSIIFSLLAAVVVYKIAQLLFGDVRKSILSSLIFYFNPLVVYYSQEARMYSQVVLLTSLVFYFFLKLISKPDFKSLFFCNLFIFLSLATFYPSIFFIFPLVVILIYKRQYKPLFLLSPSIVVFCLLLGSLLINQYLSSKAQLIEAVNWSSVLGTVSLKNLLLLPLKFSFGHISFYPKKIYWLLSGLWSAIVFIPALLNSFKNKTLIYLFIFPVLLTAVFSYYSAGGFQYFRLLFLVPILVLLLVGPSRGFWLPSLILVGFIALSLLYLAGPQFYREDWKNALADIPGSSSVVMVSSFADPVLYYRPDLNIIDLKHLPSTLPDNFYCLPYGESIHGINHLSILNPYRQVKIQNYRDVVVEMWSK